MVRRQNDAGGHRSFQVHVHRRRRYHRTVNFTTSAMHCYLLLSVVFWFNLLLALSFAVSDAAQCPNETDHHDDTWVILPDDDITSPSLPSTLEIVNQSPLPIVAYWVDSNGENSEMHWGPVAVGQSTHISTHTRHRFRIYATTKTAITTTTSVGRTSSNGKDTEDASEHNQLLLLQHTVTSSDHERLQVLGDCNGVDALVQAHREATDVEMRALVHDQQAPCLPADDSSAWSCIRHIRKDDYQERLRKYRGTSRYGFNSTEEAGERMVGDTVDLVHQGAIPSIPRVTRSGPGYMKMSFTEKMRQVLLPFYEQHKTGGIQDSEEIHRTIPGGFTNSHVVRMSIISLDRFPEVHKAVSNEIHRILEWWTNQSLVPTSTFGIRNYHRGSMLINHVDRADTHIASAVIQVAQEGVDEGWPLEVIMPDGSVGEVYLQPGELVLYEGARFQHGRPMRFNGTSFANVFSHFRPVDWHGPGKSPNYDGKLDGDGFITALQENGRDGEL